MDSERLFYEILTVALCIARIFASSNPSAERRMGVVIRLIDYVSGDPNATANRMFGYESIKQHVQWDVLA